MGATAEQLAATAEGDVGKTRDEVNCSGDHDWCAQYMSRILERNDYEIYETFVTPLHTKLLNTGLWEDIDAPQRGAFIFFDWNHIIEERPLDHVGIVVAVDGNTVRYVNGNGGDTPYKVTICEISVSSEHIIYYTQLKNSGGTFFTDKHIYDIGWPQSSDIKQCIDSIVASDCGGIIFGIGKLYNNSFEEFQNWADPNYNAVQAVAYAKTKTAVGVYVYNYAEFGQDSKTGVNQALTYLSNGGITPDDLSLGIWLDIDSEGGGPSGDPYLSDDVNTNMVNVKDFIDTCTTAGHYCAGIYTTAGVLKSSKFRCDYSFDIPIWCAWIGSGYMTFEQSSWEYMVEEIPLMANYTKVYLHQYSWIQHVSGWSGDLDGDKQFQPIPTSSGGGGGGGTVTSVTVSIIPPKRIYFSPNPDVFLGEDEFLNTSQNITITTDAENAEIYYTIDGSSPYQYQRVVGNEEWQYTLSSHAIKYTEPVTIKTDTHFRVIAVPTGTTSAIDPLLAKGSGTFLFNFTPTQYSWESEQYAYRLSDDNNKIKFFEENRQAFLRYHAEETAEEIVYNAVVAMSEQSTGTLQPDDSEVDGGGHAGQ